MNQDLISRQGAMDALGEREELDDAWTDEYEVGRFQQWKDDVEALKKLPAVQPEHLVKESGNLVKGLVNDCISRQGVIEVLSQYPFEKAVNCISIIEEFPSAQPEQTDCEFCHEDSDGYTKPLEKNNHAVIHGNTMCLKAMGWKTRVTIRFCPMCGRDLLVK